MNDVECANCVVYGWKQVEDKTKLQKCNKCNFIFYCGKKCNLIFYCGKKCNLIFYCGKKCNLIFYCGKKCNLIFYCGKECNLIFYCGKKCNLIFYCGKKCNLIFYCGKECQTDHWKKVHKRHCKYFADPSSAQQWPHKSENCSVYFNEPSQASNPRYYCVQRILNMCTLRKDLHPHPFPPGGFPGDTVEKAVIVLLQLVIKFVILQPAQSAECDELMEVCFLLACNTLEIWRKRKIYPQPEVQIYRRMNVDLRSMLSKAHEKKSKQYKPKEDPFQLWKIIMQVYEMFIRITFFRGFSVLKDPLVNLHVDFHKFVTQGVKNSANFLCGQSGFRRSRHSSDSV